MGAELISTQEFRLFQRFIFDAAGITLSDAKKALVTGRLGKRLAHHSCSSFSDYFKMLDSGRHPAEVQIAIDLLTTNETYFFREDRHFNLLRELAQAHPRNGLPFRAWSAASSTGEEAYSTAMVLDDVLGDRPWEVFGSDISSRVLQAARWGQYPIERARQMPQLYLKRYCLKGQGPAAGTLLIDKKLRQRVSFDYMNLNEPLPQMGQFDVIFLRNVMIYFSNDTKRQVAERVLGALKPGGHFLIGHSETLNDITDKVLAVAPSVYRKP